MSVSKPTSLLPEALSTERLTLEPLQGTLHYGGVRRMNADAEVMRYITGRAETPEETRVWLERIEARWHEQGHSWWAVLHGRDMVGAVALQHLAGDPTQPFEVGWRLARQSVGRGYATEAARRLLALAESRGITEILAVADPDNSRSLHVMERLGMQRVGLEVHYERELMTYRWRSSSAASVS